MTLDQFKEKLFKKKNEMSVSIDYSGTTYSVALRKSNIRISVAVNYSLNNKDQNYIYMSILTENGIKSVLYDYLLNDQAEVEEFLDIVGSYGVLND